MEKPYVVGIDIGGTNTVFGVVDARGTILYSSSIKTGKYTDVDDYVSELANGLKLVIDQAGGVDKIKGIGVGAPNGNFFNGCIEFAPNLPWKGKIPLAQLISEKVGGVPVVAIARNRVHQKTAIGRYSRQLRAPSFLISVVKRIYRLAETPFFRIERYALQVVTDFPI